MIINNKFVVCIYLFFRVEGEFISSCSTVFNLSIIEQTTVFPFGGVGKWGPILPILSGGWAA